MKTRDRIRHAFNPEALRRICTMEEHEFSAYGDRVDLEPDKTGRERFYYHQDNGSKILAVAHLDNVCEVRRCDIMNTAAGPVVFSPALDDRLGAYVILDLLPTLGLTFDWLLTTGEESGDSTAYDFVTQKSYNWVIEFDRGGGDVVMYQYETPELVDMVESSGAPVGIGSFSDIAYLDHLDVACFNWGVGYRDYHGPRSHAWLRDTFRMVLRFMKFHAMYGETQLVNEAWQPASALRSDADTCLCGDVLDKYGMCPACDAHWIERHEDDNVSIQARLDAAFGGGQDEDQLAG